MKNITIKKWATEIKKSIINDVKDIAEYHARPEKTIEGGFFSTPRQVFCYIDYLGKIVYDINSSTERAIKFLKEYFPNKYADYSELIYGMWRHGTVHEYKPKTFIAEFSGHRPKKIRIKWSSNNDNEEGNRKWNLTFFPMEGKKATLYLNINTCQLVDDLIWALDKFVTELKSNIDLFRNCKDRLKNSLQDEEVSQNKIIKTRKIKDRTIQDPIYDQILLAWENRSKNYFLNQSGGVVKRK